jgi:xanthine/CO dehydrogenase XdhC/CoxF family maturation factor
LRDLRDIAAVRERVRAGGTSAVLATVVKTVGSAYRGPGSRLLVLAEGTTAGSVGGGCLERDVVAHAEQVRETRQARVLTYDLSRDDTPWGLGARCGGEVTIFVEPLAGGFPDHLAFLLDAAERRVTVVLATLFRAGGAAAPLLGARLMLHEDGRATGLLASAPFADALLADARAVAAAGGTGVRTYPFPGGDADVLVECARPPIALLLCGDEREAAPLAALAGSLGWPVRLLGRRDAPPPLDERSATVVMNHDDARDLDLLAAFVRSPAPYVGLLGSRTRTALLLDRLGERGVPADDAGRARIHTPAGLDIGAETPGEVALAIAAEIQAVFAGKGGGPLRERKGHIHAGR